jgi:hypothetical protein
MLFDARMLATVSPLEVVAVAHDGASKPFSFRSAVLLHLTGVVGRH